MDPIPEEIVLEVLAVIGRDPRRNAGRRDIGQAEILRLLDDGLQLAVDIESHKLDLRRTGKAGEHRLQSPIEMLAELASETSGSGPQCANGRREPQVRRVHDQKIPRAAVV